MTRKKILIVDIQPIDPPIGGGRLRLLGLYHGLGDYWDATYVGTFDWQGPGPRRLRLSPCLEEIDVPLSERHFAILNRWNERMGGRNVVDVCFGFMGRMSPEYIHQVTVAMQESSVVVFTHPWVYPLVQEMLTPEHVVVYDAQNFETLLRTEIWDDGGVGTEVTKHVLATERALSQRADVVLTCSRDDARLFHKHFDVKFERIWDVPNGVFTEKIRPGDSEEKRIARIELGLDGNVAMFIGSCFPPNIQAVKFIASQLAPALPHVTFLICGGVIESPEVKNYRCSENLKLVGAVTEEMKVKYLWAADLGLNPMFAGSGTNIKMFDFMAAGLPVVATHIGARGIRGGETQGLFICEADRFSDGIRKVLKDGVDSGTRTAARALAVEKYSWERISLRLGDQLRKLSNSHTPRLASKGHSGENPLTDSSAAAAVGLEPPFLPSPRLGFVSSWAVKCGIAEYSRHLSEALTSQAWECFILDPATPEFLVSPVGSNGVSVPIESLRKIQEAGGVGIGAACRRSGVDWLLVQHHPGFFDEATLEGLVLDCKSTDVRVIITCHNTDRMKNLTLSRCVEAGARIFVHNKSEVQRLEAEGIMGVSYLPCGVIETQQNESALQRITSGKVGRPLIGTFGFLRPHKGLLELIEAFGLLREIHPESALLAMTALYPSEDSVSYLAACQSLLVEKGLDRDPRVKLDTEFHETGHVLEMLQDCDLIVLPYHSSDEGASASASFALACRRPVITTRSKVFRDTVGYTYCIDGPEPLSIAMAICNVLANPDLYEELQSLAVKYANERSWQRVAAIYERMIKGTALPEVSATTGESHADVTSEDHGELVGPEPTEVPIANDVIVNLADQILAVSPLGVESLRLDFPPTIARNLNEAATFVERVRSIVHSVGTKTDYVDSSSERYKHYIAAVLSLPKSSRILEVGAAPGHVSIAMYLAGYKSIGLNLNESWRKTYPGSEWLEKLDIREHDIEKEPLPFDAETFDSVLFTEVLEHVAIVNPLSIMKEICRVLKPGGMLIFSTPNVCNISNVWALITGVNIFWPPELFYGSLDRHNREHTPKEVHVLLSQSGFSSIDLYGINDHNNWRYGANLAAYVIVAELGDLHPLLRNTTVAVALK